MFAYCLDITSKQFCQLLTVQPHGIILQPDLEAYRLVWLVEDDFSLFYMLTQFIHSSST